MSDRLFSLSILLYLCFQLDISVLKLRLFGPRRLILQHALDCTVAGSRLKQTSIDRLPTTATTKVGANAARAVCSLLSVNNTTKLMTPSFTARSHCGASYALHHFHSNLLGNRATLATQVAQEVSHTWPTKN